jgi:hypothetical protein
MKHDELAFSGDCGRISSEIDNTIEPTHSCPKIKKHSVPLAHKTISLKQCLLRLREGNPCTKNCLILREYIEGRKFR